jgi:predicted extracellular nuclease
MNRRITIFFVLLVLSLEVFSEEPVLKYDPSGNLTFVFYNTENLFDIINNQGNRDGEFTPSGKNNWTQKRYQKKLEDISKVLSSINRQELPEIIGLSETENRDVLNDLVKTGALAKGNYRIVQYESPDYRGIDCALLFRPDEFKVTTSRAIPVKFANDPEFTTRDILYVKGKTGNGETWHIFVNHWPSRTGGLQQTEGKRVAVAKILKQKTDSLQIADPKSNVVIMGDLNDEPTNASLLKILGAGNPEKGNTPLVNLMFPLYLQNKGSYFYRGSWDMLDNIIVSDKLLDDNGFRCVERRGFVFREPWMEFKNKDGTVSPYRTYSGRKYDGGISDHLPVYFMLCK